MGLDDDGYDIQAAFFDYDHDGDLDMYLLRNAFVNYNRNTARTKQIDGGAPSTDRLYRNNGISASAPQSEEGSAEDSTLSPVKKTGWRGAMRARFRSYSLYAKATFQEAFTPAEVSDAYVVRAETFASAFIENLGNARLNDKVGQGKFEMRRLPIEAQFAPIYGMVCKDFNGDENLDVLCVGNSYSTEVQTGNYDAQGSLLLLGNGKGKFTANRKQINATGDNKAIAELISADGSSLFLISSNSDSLKVYRMHQARQKTILINPDETYAIVTSRHGIKYRQEFYYGNTYLSQSGRHLTISPNIRSAVIYNYSGKKRELDF